MTLAELEKSGLQIDANYLLPPFNWFLLGLFSFFFFFVDPSLAFHALVNQIKLTPVPVMGSSDKARAPSQRRASARSRTSCFLPFITLDLVFVFICPCRLG